MTAVDDFRLTRNIAYACDVRAPKGAKDVVQSWLLLSNLFC